MTKKKTTKSVKVLDTKDAVQHLTMAQQVIERMIREPGLSKVTLKNLAMQVYVYIGIVSDDLTEFGVNEDLNGSDDSNPNTVGDEE